MKRRVNDVPFYAFGLHHCGIVEVKYLYIFQMKDSISPFSINQFKFYASLINKNNDMRN
jgi:hypothetical protein